MSEHKYKETYSKGFEAGKEVQKSECLYYCDKNCIECEPEIRADERTKVLDELTEMFLSIRPNKITEYKCIDGVVRNRPLVDIATILEKLEQLKEQSNESM